MFGHTREATLDYPADRADWPSAPSHLRSEFRGDDVRRVLRLAFSDVPHHVQRLIADLAVLFATIDPETIDDAVADSLRQIGEALQLDQAILLWKASDEAGVVASHCWIRHPQQPLPEPLELASIPFFASRLAQGQEAGEVTWLTRSDEIHDTVDRELFLHYGLRALGAVPVVPAGSTPGGRGVLAFSSTTERYGTPAVIDLLRLASRFLGQALARKAGVESLRQALDELQQVPTTGPERLTLDDAHDGPRVRTSGLRDRRDEYAAPRREVQEHAGTRRVIGQSPAFRRVLSQVQQVAATDSTVLLLGETGTGKELVATYLHELSARRGRAMVCMNCSAIPATLLESELFGREKGAFTGALARQIGRFELADRSTIFLDEIGDLSPDVQVKLLRVLEERQIERLGSPKAIPVDVRIIAATHRNLEQKIGEDAFREDLFYRLNVFPIQIPALRDRAEDIPLLVWHFVEEFSKTFGKRVDSISPESMAALQRYSWPGNIRELRNIVERAMIVTTSSRLAIAPPRRSGHAGKSSSVALVDVEREHIRAVLESTSWRIRGSGGAAERLGLRPTTLETRMAKLGLVRPQRA